MSPPNGYFSFCKVEKSNPSLSTWDYDYNSRMKNWNVSIWNCILNKMGWCWWAFTFCIQPCLHSLCFNNLNVTSRSLSIALNTSTRSTDVDFESTLLDGGIHVTECVIGRLEISRLKPRMRSDPLCCRSQNRPWSFSSSSVFLCLLPIVHEVKNDNASSFRFDLLFSFICLQIFSQFLSVWSPVTPCMLRLPALG